MNPRYILIELPCDMDRAELEEEVARFCGHFVFPGVTRPPLVLTEDHYIEVRDFGDGAPDWRGVRLI